MLIKAVALFLQQREDVDDNRLMAALQEIDPLELEDNAKASVKISGGNTVGAMVTAIERQYARAGRGGGGVAAAARAQSVTGEGKELSGHSFSELKKALGKRLTMTKQKDREIWWLDDSICTIQQAIAAARQAGFQ